jgi:hypothetical protein
VWLSFLEGEEEGEGVIENDTIWGKAILTSVDIISQVGFGRNRRNNNTYVFWDMGRCEENSINSQLWLSLKDGNKPSDGVLSIVNYPQEWSFDCAEFVQVIIWYAALQVYGKDNFDNYINSILNASAISCIDRFFTLTQQNATGIIQDKIYTKYTPTEKFMDETSMNLIEGLIEESEAELLQQCPIGTRIALKNMRAPEFSAYQYENAIKIGDNLYGAHGLSQSKLLLDNLKTVLAELTYMEESEEFKSKISLKEYTKQNVFVSQIEIYKIEIK